jgi:hypothetical protein
MGILNKIESNGYYKYNGLNNLRHQTFVLFGHLSTDFINSFNFGFEIFANAERYSRSNASILNNKLIHKS